MDTLGKVAGGDMRKAITTLQSAVRLRVSSTLRIQGCRSILPALEPARNTYTPHVGCNWPVLLLPALVQGIHKSVFATAALHVPLSLTRAAGLWHKRT